jgi:hypothetical protein
MLWRRGGPPTVTVGRKRCDGPRRRSDRWSSRPSARSGTCGQPSVSAWASPSARQRPRTPRARRLRAATLPFPCGCGAREPAALIPILLRANRHWSTPSDVRVVSVPFSSARAFLQPNQVHATMRGRRHVQIHGFQGPPFDSAAKEPKEWAGPQSARSGLM